MAVDVSDLRRAVEECAADLFDLAALDRLTVTKADAPYRDGALTKSGRLEPIARGEGLYASLLIFDATPRGDSNSYASYTDTGSRPHEIRPKNAKALAFRVGGQLVFAKVVHHPGTRGTRWFSDAVTPTAWAEALQAASAGLVVN